MMSIMGFGSVYGKNGYEKTAAAASLTKAEKEEGLPSAEKATEEGLAQNVDRVEISEEGRLAAEQGEESPTPAVSVTAEQDEEAKASNVSDSEDEESSEQCGGKVAVNELKRARQIAAAKNQAQVQQVLALLQGDMSDCKAGLEKGWCDETEIAKVEALINRAKARMSQVPQESADDQAGIDAFELSSLM